MGRTQPVLFGLLLIALLAALPPPHPEARLFSDGWGAANFVDPNFCMTPIEGQAPRTALFVKTPRIAPIPDRLMLAVQYLAFGLLLPVFAVLAVLRMGVRYPLLLSFGLLGLAPAWFQWPLNPAFIALRQWLAETWLAFGPLLESQFVWLDGIALCVWLAGGALLAGGVCFLATRSTAWLAGVSWRESAKALVPLAGATVLLGLTQPTAFYLRGEGVNLDGLPGLRAALLVFAIGCSGALGVHSIVKVGAGKTACKFAASLLWLIPLSLTALHGWAMYFHWTSRYHV